MIYFIQADGGPVKIGVAVDVFARVSQIQSNHPFPIRLLGVIDGDRTAELALHARFKALRLRGEWFSLSGELEEFIKSLPKPPKSPRQIQRENAKPKKAKGKKGFQPGRHAKEIGRAGGKAKGVNAAAARMAENSARRIWLNKSIATNAEAIDKMTGWSRESAYRKFGPSGRPPGRAGS